MLFFRKLFKLPSPINLGWSKYDALEDEEFSDNPQGKTWQEWHRTVKKMHPIRYWIAETFGDFLRYKVWLPLTRPFETARYWFVSHFIPSRRYHFLDLRQPNGYRYGWADVPCKMLFAMFNLLGEYLNKEEPYDLTKDYSREEINADVGMKHQQDSLEEARAIYHWWSVDRLQEIARRDEMLNKWYTAKEAKDSKQEKYWQQLQKMNEEFEVKTDEMIVRLMKIRKSLWT